MPPSICPITWVACSTLPTSCPVAICTTRTSPRSGSTSTTARWAAKTKPTSASPWPRSSSVVVGRWRWTAAASKASAPAASATVTSTEASPDADTRRPSSVSTSDSAATPRRPASALRTWSATRSAARCTAPPDIQVWRDAEDDPAEPTPTVSAGSITAAWQPRTVRAICVAMVTKPWPTSATAHVTVATPPASRTRYPLAGGQHVAGGEGVAQPQLDRIDAEARGEAVHLRLVTEAHLHGAESTHGTARRVVGADDGGVDQRVGHPVGAAGEASGVAHDRRRRRGVGPAVEQHLGLDLDQVAGPGGVVPEVQAGGVAVHVAEERLVAQVAHLHGVPGVQRQQAGVDLHAHVLAPAKGAADAAEVQPHLVVRQAQARGDLVAVLVQPLGRDPQVDTALAVGNGEPRLGAEEGLVLHPHLVGALDHHVAPDAGFAVLDPDVPDEVAVGVDRVGGSGGGRVG